MKPATCHDPVLDRLRSALADAYGDRLERAVLFGSRARGDARPDSDYDVAIFLFGPDDPWAGSERLAEIETAILDETGGIVHTLPYPAGAYAARTPLMHEIRQEGIEL